MTSARADLELAVLERAVVLNPEHANHAVAMARLPKNVEIRWNTKHTRVSILFAGHSIAFIGFPANKTRISSGSKLYLMTDTQEDSDLCAHALIKMLDHINPHSGPALTSAAVRELARTFSLT